MGKKRRTPSPLGQFLRDLREKKGVTLREVELATGVSNVYISQLETGSRNKIPGPENLKALAGYFNVMISEFLEKAGYEETANSGETLEQRTNRAFQHVVNDPHFKFGTRIRKDPDLDTKRFVIEMYEKATGKKLL
jgi:transcriptional regulator with XRE-family HTH domain